jgi:hypothetical protein
VGSFFEKRLDGYENGGILGAQFVYPMEAFEAAAPGSAVFGIESKDVRHAHRKESADARLHSRKAVLWGEHFGTEERSCSKNLLLRVRTG